MYRCISCATRDWRAVRGDFKVRHHRSAAEYTRHLSTTIVPRRRYHARRTIESYPESGRNTVGTDKSKSSVERSLSAPQVAAARDRPRAYVNSSNRACERDHSWKQNNALFLQQRLRTFPSFSGGLRHDDRAYRWSDRSTVLPRGRQSQSTVRDVMPRGGGSAGRVFRA